MICSKNPHAKRCIEYPKPPFFACTCEVGYQCRFCNLTSHPCDNNFTYCNKERTKECVPSKSQQPSEITCDRPTCNCKPGWQGEDCSEDIDECKQYPPVCQHGGTCTNLPGSFRCSCLPQYGWKDCSKAASCLKPSVICAKGAVCKQTLVENYSYGVCQCVAPLKGDGYSTCGVDHTAQAQTTGDPHTLTFDNHTKAYSYQGTCPVTLVRPLRPIPHVPDFKVVVKASNFVNPGLNPKVSWIQFVYLDVYGHRFTIHASDNVNRQIYVDTVATNLPFMQMSPNVTADVVGFTDSSVDYQINTVFGLVVKVHTYKPHDFYAADVYVTLPSDGVFFENVVGLAGTMSGKSSDDWTKPDGSITTDMNDFGDSWAAENMDDYDSFGCVFGKDIAVDTEKDKEDIEWAASSTQCSHFTDKKGPFQLCFENMAPEKQEVAYKACIYDLARFRQSTTKVIQKEACENYLEPFGKQCALALQEKHVDITQWQWRAKADCPSPTCPENAHFYEMAPQCIASCADPLATSNCPTTNLVPRCMCDVTPLSKYVMSGGKCVLFPKECPGKTNLGVTLSARKSETDLLCQQDCLWLGPNAAVDGVFCKPLNCAENSKYEC